MDLEREQSSVITGVGIHTGRNFIVRISTNPEVEGINFYSEHFQKRYESPASWTRLSGTARSTALVLRGEDNLRFELRTVEHFLAAAHVLGLEGVDVFVRSSGSLIHSSDFQTLELPVLDGSARQWIRFIQEYQIRENRVIKTLGRKVFKVHRSFELKDGLKCIALLPPRSGEESMTRYSCAVDFGSAWQQEAEFSINWMDPKSAVKNFGEKIAPARTFGFQAELKDLEDRGLAKGAALNNAILLDGDRVVNEGGLLFPNELAAHKLVDAIGDFALAGRPIIGQIEVTRGGHAAHLRALSEAVKSGVLISGYLNSTGCFSPES